MLLLSEASHAGGRIGEQSEFGTYTVKPCPPRQRSSITSLAPSECKKVTFYCQEKQWHIPDIWRIMIEPWLTSYDLALGKHTPKKATLITGSHLTEHKYHELVKMDPWIIIPIEKNEDIDKKLIIHQEKLSGAMVIDERVFSKSEGYTRSKRKYYCRQSVEDYDNLF